MVIPYPILLCIHSIASIDIKLALEKALGLPKQRDHIPIPPHVKVRRIPVWDASGDHVVMLGIPLPLGNGGRGAFYFMGYDADGNPFSRFWRLPGVNDPSPLNEYWVRGDNGWEQKELVMPHYF